MLKNDKTEKRKARHKVTQEDFTPDCVINTLLSNISDFGGDKTFLDNSCGIGNILVEILKHKLNNCKSVTDAYSALSSIYGVELMADNVEDCRNNLYNTVLAKYPYIDTNKVRAIIKNRIQWHDSLTFDYDNWPLLKYNGKEKYIDFKEYPTEGNIKYPMWEQSSKKIIQLSLFNEDDF